MDALTEARLNIRAALATAASPAVLCSFGKDSMLLLALCREVSPYIPVLWYRTGQDERFAKQIIRDWGLTAFSPAPSDVYLLTNGNERAIVHEYSWGGETLPMVSDLAPGERCSLTAYPDRTRPLFWPFDLVLVGYKDSDTHWTKGDAPLFQEGTTVGKAIYLAPIRHMSDTQVLAAIHDLEIPYRPVEDSLPLCTECMTGKSNEVWCPELKRFIPVEKWEADRSLTAFKRRFRLEESNG